MQSRALTIACVLSCFWGGIGAKVRAELPLVKSVERQPLVAQVKRVVDALDHLGVPLREADRRALDAAMTETDTDKAVEAIQQVLDSKKQGAITGPAHSGSGLAPSTERVADTDGPNQLPNYAIPRYDGIGANEYIVDITHQIPGPDGKPVPAIDFISTMDTNRQQEFNMWYHTLNSGFRVRASGETDFPCISGARVGMGRVYVKVDGKLNYNDWCEGIRDGRSYVSDGTSHFLEFAASPSANPQQVVRVGVNGSELKLDQPATIRLTARVAARLGDKLVPVEAIVNAYPVKQQEIVADGKLRELTFEVPIERSSWVALRLFPSAHTNPIFVIVGDQPIRASRRSVEWCLRGVEQCWKEKQKFYAAAEQEEAAKAYEHARVVYRQLLSESRVE